MDKLEDEMATGEQARLIVKENKCPKCGARMKEVFLSLGITTMEGATPIKMTEEGQMIIDMERVKNDPESVMLYECTNEKEKHQWQVLFSDYRKYKAQRP